MAIHRILIDKGKELTDHLCSPRKREITGKYKFERLFAELDRKRRLSSTLYS